jgi:4-hydroxythreonine-4-phosphate dehydrogenase
VTAPLHKEALSAAGVAYPGHTELLQAEAAATKACRWRMPVRMMLANDELRTVLVSIHMSLRDAIDAVTPENVCRPCRSRTQRLLLQPSARVPRIAVAGLNPHAGEGGLFGREEIEIIAPAIETPRAGMDVHGPLRPTRCSCALAIRAGVPGSSMWWWPCTTTRG